MLTNQTIDLLRSLKLHGMANAFEQQLLHPATYDLPFEERFGLLVDREVSLRDSRRLARLLKSANLRHNACIEDIDYHKRRSGLDRRQIANLASCDWVRARQNLIITGPTGIGKSWLATAFAQAACRQGLSVLHARCSRLLEDLHIAHGNGSFARKLHQLARIDLLLLDDWGMAKLTQSERMDLLEVLEDRCAKRSTIVTSQVPVSDWHHVVGSPTLGDAIVDRLLTSAHQVTLSGQSMRPHAPESKYADPG